jgi:hypothetical protein
MQELDKTNGNQTAKGTFAPGNKVGNRFPKGESGNPDGRPKKTRLTDALREQLQQSHPQKPEETIAELIAKKLINEALKGNIQAIREIGDRTEGKPKQSIDLDMQVNDWRRLAQSAGVSEEDVLIEAKLLIESAVDSSGE